MNDNVYKVKYVQQIQKYKNGKEYKKKRIDMILPIKYADYLELTPEERTIKFDILEDKKAIIISKA